MIHDSEKKLGILISMFGVLCLTLSLTLAASISNENTVESKDYYSDLRQQFIMQNASAIVNYSWVGSGTQINDFSVFKSIAKHVDAKTMFFYGDFTFWFFTPNNEIVLYSPEERLP